jgi:3-mercaptopyruvate sulfurtransferase SseA
MDPEWVADHLGDGEVLVCDCRFSGDREHPRHRYGDGHIPGAVHVL